MTTTDHRITKDDIEGKLRELAGDVNEQAEAAKGVAITVGAVVAAAVVVGIFLLGKSRGKKKTTMIEVRRF
ncbi:MAG: hypothetical protein JWN46_2736 [Acidimicrobiales bacterium]|nr:hypothetical protein [Acidimicrobiales bacterium]